MKSVSNTVFRFFTSKAGILALDYYFPAKYVSQPELEVFDDVSEGKYSVGLGQRSLSFVNDREDSVSLMLTALNNLMTNYDIKPEDIETPVDRSKSIKSYLMQLFESEFEDNTSIEGTDNINACFGGTQAIFDALNWVEAHKDVHNKYAVVVCGDCATYKEPNARATSGAGAVAILIGKNATFKFDIKKKMFHVEHVFDFYKPDPKCIFPVVHGHYSNECFLRSLDRVYTKGDFHLDEVDYCLFHSPYNKLVQKSVGFLKYLDMVNSKDPNSVSSGFGCQEYLEIDRKDSYSHGELLNCFKKASEDIYEQKGQPGTFLPKHIGNSYTSSLYLSLISLIDQQCESMIESVSDSSPEKILMYSYGSGLVSAMFEICATDQEENEKFTIENIKKVIDVSPRMEHRMKCSAKEYHETERSNSQNYRTNFSEEFSPEGSVECLREGTFYLDSIDHHLRRKYKKK